MSERFSKTIIAGDIPSSCLMFRCLHPFKLPEFAILLWFFVSPCMMRLPSAQIADLLGKYRLHGVLRLTLCSLILPDCCVNLWRDQLFLLRCGSHMRHLAPRVYCWCDLLEFSTYLLKSCDSCSYFLPLVDHHFLYLGHYLS